MCAVCNEAIQGDSVVANGKSFHPGCMRCYICDELSLITYQDKPICELHYKVR